ncbi:hypothetical protein ACH4PU_31270 [Streptomyces sp. NPDC021100]|uniref:hypothetical protein n=1 Tax=Streptomyces sp. NPDC021100 TaxID=3365114 RepID=UPI00378F724B
MTTQPTRTRIKPAASWPNYDGDIARAELAAMELLVQRMPESRVVRRTGLSAHRVHRLAQLVEEDSKNPPRPRNVCRRPQPRPTPRTAEGHHVTAAVQPMALREPEQLALL